MNVKCGGLSFFSAIATQRLSLMDSANRTRRVYEAKTLFLGEAGEGERRCLLILKPVFLRNFRCCGWPSIATKHVKKKWRPRQLSPQRFLCQAQAYILSPLMLARPLYKVWDGSGWRLLSNKKTGISNVSSLRLSFELLITDYVQVYPKFPTTPKRQYIGLFNISYWDNIQEVGKFSSRSTTAK